METSNVFSLVSCATMGLGGLIGFGSGRYTETQERSLIMAALFETVGLVVHGIIYNFARDPQMAVQLLTFASFLAAGQLVGSWFRAPIKR